MHLLMECPYSQAIYSLLGINADSVEAIIGVNLNRWELEIWCDLLNYLVFKQHMLPPETLVRSTLEKFAKGLVGVEKITRLAQNKLSQL